MTPERRARIEEVAGYYATQGDDETAAMFRELLAEIDFRDRQLQRIVGVAGERRHPKAGTYTTYDPDRPWTSSPIGDDGWWELAPQWVKDHG